MIYFYRGLLQVFFESIPNIIIPNSVGNQEVPLNPFDAFSSGNFNNVPIILGTVSQDALFFIYEAAKNNVSNADYILLVSYLFELHAPKILEMYPPHDVFESGGTVFFFFFSKIFIFNLDDRPIISVLGTDYVFVCPTRNIAALLSNFTDVYQYQFDHVLSFDPWGEYQFCADKVCHGAELPLLWHVAAPFYTFSSDEETLSFQMIHYWTNFAMSGSPNSPQSVKTQWPNYNSSSNQILILSTPSNYVSQDLRIQNCDYFDSIGYLWGT